MQRFSRSYKERWNRKTVQEYFPGIHRCLVLDGIGFARALRQVQVAQGLFQIYQVDGILKVVQRSISYDPYQVARTAVSRKSRCLTICAVTLKCGQIPPTGWHAVGTLYTLCSATTQYHLAYMAWPRFLSSPWLSCDTALPSWVMKLQ